MMITILVTSNASLRETLSGTATRGREHERLSEGWGDREGAKERGGCV
jgi:hypothetical protein